MTIFVVVGGILWSVSVSNFQCGHVGFKPWYSSTHRSPEGIIQLKTA